jgi:hypothetical protein
LLEIQQKIREIPSSGEDEIIKPLIKAIIIAISPRISAGQYAL